MLIRDKGESRLYLSNAPMALQSVPLLGYDRDPGGHGVTLKMTPYVFKSLPIHYTVIQANCCGVVMIPENELTGHVYMFIATC